MAPMLHGIAGGAGMLMLVPLSIVALVSVPIGVFLSVSYRRDIVLPALSILTMLCSQNLSPKPDRPSFITPAQGYTESSLYCLRYTGL